MGKVGMDFRLFLFVITIMFTFTLVANFNDVHAVTIGNSETMLSENQYSFGLGILEYRQVSEGSCVSDMPNYTTAYVDASEQTLLNIDEFTNNFFAVIGNHDDASYQYLQIGLPSGSGYASYLLDLRDDEKVLHGGLYQGYENLAALAESDTKINSLSDDSYKRFFTGNSTDITHDRNTHAYGIYNFGAILFKSSKPNWVGNEECVMRVDWPFTINQEGHAITGDPAVSLGKLFDITEDFAPLKQHKAGVFAIDCKPGLRLILKTAGDSEQTPACVTPDTQKKLMDRGWGQLR